MTTILAIPASLRDHSYNRLLLHAAEEVAPPDVTISTCEIGDLPHYNQDLDTDSPPEPVVRLRRAIADADAVLIASPEYNASISGVLKDAIDWASRPYGRAPLQGKPIAFITASITPFGGTSAQDDLRAILTRARAEVVDAPRVAVGNAADAFDDEGRLKDPQQRDALGQLLADLVEAGRERERQTAALTTEA